MNTNFVGRMQELKQLNALWSQNTAGFAVIKGRRRIGKSRLIQEFASKAPYGTTFIALSGLPPAPGITAMNQREDFARQLARLFDISVPASEDWGDLFYQLAHNIQDEPTIVLLDEISWMGLKDPTFLGKLKNAWDLLFKQKKNLILILCSSVSSWIEDNILHNTGFVGRIDLVLTLDELSLKESLALLGKGGEKLSAFEFFKLLSVTGGVPRYLESLLPQYSAEDNIKRLCFTKGGLLFREFDQIFHDLFSTRSALYTEILEAISKTSNISLDELFSKLNKAKSGVFTHYLSDLEHAGFIARDYTWDLKKATFSSLSRYRISDNYIRFYLKYIHPIKEKIAKGDFKDKSLSALPGWDAIMGLQFENLIIKNRRALHSVLHINPDEILQDGSYFQRKTTKQKGCQIDYLIQTKFNSYTVVEIKFSKNPIGPEVVGEVQHKIQALNIPKHASCRPVLIHVNGVEDSLIGEEFFSSIINFGDLLTL